MTFSKFLMTMAAASLAGSPAMAAPANPAASLSVAKARAGSKSAHDSALGGGGGVIAIIGAVAVIVSIIIVASDNDNNSSSR